MIPDPTFGISFHVEANRWNKSSVARIVLVGVGAKRENESEQMSPDAIWKRREPNPRNRFFTPESRVPSSTWINQKKDGQRGKRKSGNSHLIRECPNRGKVGGRTRKRGKGRGGYKRSNCKIAAALCGDRTVRTVSKLFDVYDAAWFTIYLCHGLVFVIIIIIPGTRTTERTIEKKLAASLTNKRQPF